MYPNHDRDHASVPVRVTTLSVVYCHACQAWRVTGWTSEMHSDADLDTAWSEELDLGPFDREGDVRLALIEMMARAPLGPPRLLDPR